MCDISNDIEPALRVGWQIPAHSISLWSGRQRDFCIVIPVINEGPRIRSLLGKMTRLRIDAVADILIVDGGSTDGSLGSAILTENHVRGLLRQGRSRQA